MRWILTTTILLALLSSASCRSKPQPGKGKPGEPDGNVRHWDGTTEVLKTYRFPSSPNAAKKPGELSFRNQAGSGVKKQQEVKPPK